MSPAASPMGTPAAASAPQVTADSHGQQLRNLGRQRWYLPAITVANAAGFEGSGAVAALNNWIAKLKRDDAIPRDVEEYNVYPVDSRAQYYISGDEKLKSSTSIGIEFTLEEQKHVVNILEAPQYRAALSYGMGKTNEYVVEDEAKEEWELVLVPLCAAYAAVFHIEAPDLMRLDNTASDVKRHSYRRFLSELEVALNDMQRAGVLILTDPLPDVDQAKPDLPKAPPPPAPHAQPSPSAPPVAPVAKMIPALINFKSDNKVWSDGNERRAFEDRTRISMIRMKEADVSDVQAPALLVDLLRLWGHTIEGDLPTRDIAKQATEEGGMLAFCMIAQQLLDWGLTDEQQLECVTAVNTECDREVLTERKGSPQVATACADGASIGEDKFIAVAMQKLIEVQGVEAVQKKFVRVALPLIHLADGSDEVKQAALMDSMEDILTCYNTICAPESEEMTMYDIARIIGFCVNDHAESVVKNQFAPALQKIIEAANGTEQEVALTRLWLWSGVPPVLPVITKIFVFGAPQRGAFIEPDGKPAGYLADKRDSLRLTQGAGRVRLPLHLREYILTMIYTPDVDVIRRSSPVDNQMFCNRHKLAVTLDGGMTALTAAEGQEGSALQAQAAAEEGSRRQTRYKLSGALGGQAVRTVSFILGKPKKVSETLSHGTLHRCIKGAVQSATRHPRFTRLLGSRGQKGVMANALPTLIELADRGDWGAVGFADASDAKSGSTNDAHQGIRNHAESDLVMAELRVWALLDIALITPLEHYIQSNTTQRDMVSCQKEYRDQLKKLQQVTALTLVADGTSNHFPELPWISGALHSAAEERRVLARPKAKEKREAELAMVFKPPGLEPDRNTKQLGLMVHVLTHMAAGMLKKLEGLMDARYGGLFSMTDEELDASETHLIPATSDAIERYFGLASWLEQQNPNLTRQNHSYRLSMKETKVGSKLVAMYLESEASRGRVSRMLYRTRKYRVEFGQRMLDRKKQVLADRIIGYELARQKKREKDATSAAELEKMRGEARRWVHLEMSHRSERRSASSTISTRREAVPTITSLVEQTREQTRGSESVKNQAAQAMLLRWLTVFHTVHGLSGVSSLASVFFNPKSGRLCIKSEPRLSDGKMEDKSLAQLMENVAACSSYLAEKGSPAGFQGDAPGAPGGGGASGPSGVG